MPSIPLDIFSSSEGFKLYIKTYPLVPGFVLVGWYIEIRNLKSDLPNFRNSQHGAATEAIQSLEHGGQQIIFSDHGILFLSGILRSEKYYEKVMLKRDRHIVSEEVGIVRGDPIIAFRRAFEHLRIDEGMEQNHRTYIDFINHDLTKAGCLELKHHQWQAAHGRSSDSNRRKRPRHVHSSKCSRRKGSSYKECDEVPAVKQEKARSAASRSHKSTRQHAPQVPVEQEYPIMPLTEENLSAVSERYNSQVGSQTHRRRREVEATLSRKSRLKVGGVITLHGAESDPGVESRYPSPRSHTRSISSDSYTLSDSGTRSSTTSTTSSLSRSSYTSSRSRSKDTLNLDIAGREVHMLFGPGRTHPPPASDDDETVYNIKVRERKKRPE
ncbi:hypothetical protein BOTCAL_0058g00110 [Botryotinia calthae]|uniref:Uncharacterized protein n=1 Tax=Botryotinia calthae TaxID=38488 RepID=A0A4Y8DAL3_9HELO|nr:hypothetical protein BOTCAL_0058g00110 [Botryotinia calthae]